MELRTRIQLIALLLCLCSAPIQATQSERALNITVYHCGVLPSDMQSFKVQDAVVHSKDLCVLERIGQQITAQVIGRQSINPQNSQHISTLQERIKQLDQKTIESMRAASVDYLEAYRAGISKNSPLPAIAFKEHAEEHGKQRLYYQRTLARAYRLWRARP